MRDIVDDLLRTWHSGRTGGLGTVVRTLGAAPLPVGANMLIDPEGNVHGAMAAGGLDEIAYEAVLQAARTGRRATHRYSVSAPTDSGVGDGMMDVFTEPFSRQHFPEFPDVAAELRANRRVTVFTVVWNSEPGLIGQHLITDKRHATELVALPDSDVFVASHAPAPRLLIFGANSFAAALAVQARLIGYRVTICDSRASAARPEAFPGAEVVVDWPHRYLNTMTAAGEVGADTAIVLTAHDPMFEIPLLTVALRLQELGYLGAMGSRTAHAQRMDDLRAGGFGEALLARLHSPAGLELGARSAAEVAVAIAAELLAARGGRQGLPTANADPTTKAAV
ncbi:XdhC family protein [Nocardia callitridis]|uniref:XdhC family protein n=1 Tax=Nocardia callitridis TaxID=648753 RepID=A0ABP9JY13_9NOCA